MCKSVLSALSFSTSSLNSSPKIIIFEPESCIMNFTSSYASLKFIGTITSSRMDEAYISSINSEEFFAKKAIRSPDVTLFLFNNPTRDNTFDNTSEFV